jgi:hypothetical protein
MDSRQLAELVCLLQRCGEIIVLTPGRDSRLSVSDEDGAIVVYDNPLSLPSVRDRWQEYLGLIPKVLYLLHVLWDGLLVALHDFGEPQPAVWLRKLESTISFGAVYGPNSATEGNLLSLGMHLRACASTLERMPLGSPCAAAPAAHGLPRAKGTGRKRATPTYHNARRDEWVNRQRAKNPPKKWEDIYDDLVVIGPSKNWQVPGSWKALAAARDRYLKRKRTKGKA